MVSSSVHVSASTLMVGWQEGHPAIKSALARGSLLELVKEEDPRDCG